MKAVQTHLVSPESVNLCESPLLQITNFCGEVMWLWLGTANNWGSLSELHNSYRYNHLYLRMYVCMYVCSDTSSTCSSPTHIRHYTSAATLPGKGWWPHVNSKYCTSKLQHWNKKSSRSGMPEETRKGKVGSVKIQKALVEWRTNSGTKKMTSEAT